MAGSPCNMAYRIICEGPADTRSGLSWRWELPDGTASDAQYGHRKDAQRAALKRLRDGAPKEMPAPIKKLARPKTNDEMRAYLKSNVTVDPETGCWMWRGSAKSRGYGMIAVEGYARRAHRASWEAFRGPIPPKMFACHHCDRPGCINPDHLFIGTCRDNIDDMMRKGRHRLPRRNEVAVPKEEWVISKDGPHTISPSRRWLARQLMDSHLSDAEALSVVAYAPEVRAALTSEQGADQ